MSRFDRNRGRSGRWSVWVFAVALLGLLEGLSGAGQPEFGRMGRGALRPGAERLSRSRSVAVEIHGGFVIAEACYVAPPYVVESERGYVRVNGHEIAPVRSRGLRRPPARGPHGARSPQGREVLQIEQHLRSEGLLVCVSGAPMQFVSPGRAVALFEVLMGEKSDKVKVQTLIEEHPALMGARQWIALVETFETPAGLAERVAKVKEHEAMLEVDPTEGPWLGRMPMTAATILGFALAVWALGTLLGCRPPTKLDPSITDLPGHSAHQVVRLVILIMVLGGYDLVCTLLAEHLGGLWELNPFAHSLVVRTASVTAFKLILTVGAGILLVVARRTRLAQVGSWWVGVFYTVLILRWATYNSVFMA